MQLGDDIPTIAEVPMAMVKNRVITVRMIRAWLTPFMMKPIATEPSKAPHPKHMLYSPILIVLVAYNDEIWSGHSIRFE